MIYLPLLKKYYFRQYLDNSHVNNIVSDEINNEIIQFTETQVNLSDSTCKIIETLNFVSINFNNNEKKDLCLAYRCRHDVAVLDKFDANGVSIFTLMLAYRKQFM